jgi:hypothetical protein
MGQHISPKNETGHWIMSFKKNKRRERKKRMKKTITRRIETIVL